MLLIATSHPHDAFRRTSSSFNRLKSILDRFGILFIDHIGRCSTESSEVDRVLPSIPRCAAYMQLDEDYTPDSTRIVLKSCMIYKHYSLVISDACLIIWHWPILRYSHIGLDRLSPVPGGRRPDHMGDILVYPGFHDRFEKKRVVLHTIHRTHVSTYRNMTGSIGSSNKIWKSYKIIETIFILV